MGFGDTGRYLNCDANLYPPPGKDGYGEYAVYFCRECAREVDERWLDDDRNDYREHLDRICVTSDADEPCPKHLEYTDWWPDWETAIPRTGVYRVVSIYESVQRRWPFPR